MINIKIKYILLTLMFLAITEGSVISKIKLEILYKINNEIITNIDLENEIKFLAFLNPNLKNLSKEQINKIANNSLKNRKIKEIELRKYIDLNKDNLGKVYVESFITSSNYENSEMLIKDLKEIKLEYIYLDKNFAIDNLWKEFIFNKFKSQVVIDEVNLRKQIKNQQLEIEELNLSEILFETSAEVSFDELKNKIYNEIKLSGFEAAASIFSISNSKNFGGKLGWVKSNQISPKIYSEIKKTEKITSPVKINNGYLIIKINERRKASQEINIENELQKLINIETDKELNKFGYIYFNKIKKRIFISEN